MLWWVMQNVIIVAVLAAAVSLICRWKRLSPAARHLLWLMVLLKLVTPPLFVWPWEIPVSAETLTEVVNVNQNLNQPQAVPFEEIETSLSGPAEVGDEKLSETDGLIVSSETFVVPLNTDAKNKWKSPVPFTSVLPEIQSRMQAEQRSVRNFEKSVFWGSIIWITGIIVMASWQGLRIWKMNRLVNTAQPAPEWLSRLLAETSSLLSIRAPQIVLVRGISTPLLWAWGRPMLLWPEELSQQLSPQAQQGVLLHELAHLKRKDHWVGRLELVAGCLWWPNPLFWYVRHQLRENAELACDAWVVQTLPNGRRDYADALLTVCQIYSHPAVPLPALGMGKSTRRTLERRLTMILRDRVPFRVSWWGMIAVLLLGVLILPGWSQSKKESPQLPAVESKDEVTDELAAPAAGVEAGSIQVPVVTSDGRRTIIIKPPLENAATTERVLLQKALEETLQREFVLEGKEIVVDRVNPKTARMRDRQLQELEKKLQSLLGELRELSGKKDASFRPRLAKDEQEVDLIHFQFLAREAKRRDTATANYAKPNYAKANAALAAAQRQKQAEVVETKTITLVRTTYRITRVDSKSLEEFLKRIVKADMLQIQTTKRPVRMKEGPFGRMPVEFDQTITVTTTPETQDYIGRLIALIEKAPRLEGPRRQKPSTERRFRFRDSEIRTEQQEQFQEQRPVRRPESEFRPSNRRRTDTKRGDY